MGGCVRRAEVAALLRGCSAIIIFEIEYATYFCPHSFEFSASRVGNAAFSFTHVYRSWHVCCRRILFCSIYSGSLPRHRFNGSSLRDRPPLFTSQRLQTRPHGNQRLSCRGSAPRCQCTRPNG